MNYHEILGIQPGANEEEIKKAYRSQAMKYHPDRNPGDVEAAEQFKKVQEAYDRLTNKNPQPQDQPFDVNDIFSTFFGFGGFGPKRRPEPRGRDIYAKCELTFMEAALGCEKTVNIRRGESCTKCNGTGAESTESCPACNGAGNVSYRQGNMTVSSTCGQCQGAGKFISKRCEECAGDGLIKDTIPIQVKIPEGIRNGDSIRLPGQGEKRGRPGDAYINITVGHHNLFTREHDDITYVVPITYTQAVFGDTIKVPTLLDKQEITIEPGLKTKEVRLYGMGLTNPQNGRRGDCVVRFEIDTSMPNKEAEKHLRKFSAKEGISDVRKVYLDKVN